MAGAASNPNPNHLVAAAAAFAVLLAIGDASSFGFNLHHRSSSVVRRWAEARGHALASQWPADGSPEYYSAQSRHDRALLARRGLAGADGLVVFADGNDTHRISSLGFLYYAEVALGTPNATFLVALDTGSDLFWVPCDCKQCAPVLNATAAGSQGLRPYSPRLSSTSKPVTCAHALCDQPTACGGNTTASCPYAVNYVSANTSSSGVLVEDVLYLAREGPGGGGAAEAVQAPVVFGCGQVQTGLFLEGGGEDGLLGLGLDKVSVPSMLAASGLVAYDSFSMCFSPDGVGRINFGDAGDRDQAETPFVVRIKHPTYNVSFTSINVGNKSVPVPAPFAAVMDSGTSFAYLKDPEYTQLATNFNSQVQEKRVNFSSKSEGSFPFDYCYELSSSEEVEVMIPEVSLTTEGGALFPVTRPIIVLGDATSGKAIGYCLAIVKSDIPISIVGQNFMTGLKMVFDRERSVLGWQQFDCYKNAKVADSPAGSPADPPVATLTPQQNDASNRYPAGAAPLPTSAAAASLSLLLPLTLMLAGAAAAL